MSQTDPPLPAPPATPGMAFRLAANRTGQFTAAQRRLALIAGGGALALLLCPLALLVQTSAFLLSRGIPGLTPGGVLFTACGALVMVGMAGLVGVNAASFLPEALQRRPVAYAIGPLVVHASSRYRPELPFSYIVGDYSFAPYVPPPELELHPGARYVVYYAARSRVFLSIAALDAPDGAQWTPQF